MTVGAVAIDTAQLLDMPTLEAVENATWHGLVVEVSRGPVELVVLPYRTTPVTVWAYPENVPIDGSALQRVTIGMLGARRPELTVLDIDDQCLQLGDEPRDGVWNRHVRQRQCVWAIAA